MDRLPDALAALGQYRQFILWAIASGRKLPLSPRTGQVIDPHDAQHWVGHEEAVSAAAVMGAGVGFVFTAADPFWFLDIDHCHTAEGWSRTATELCAYFAGAAVEVSHSGEGLHLFGTARDIPPHRTRPADNSYEFYTSGRFVALTGTSATGDAGADFTPHVQALIAHALTPEQAGPVAEWTDGPREDWRGPEDDEELLARALRSQSAASAFGGRATFANLYYGDVDALAENYPHTEEPYDRSAADSALFQHLAFWTGCDCERMLRIARTSALYREKWEREDYITGTIRKVVGRCEQVYRQGGADVPEPTPAPAPAQEAPGLAFKEGLQYLAIDGMATYFQGCAYVRDVHKVFCPDGSLLKSDQFKAYYGGYVFPLDAINDKTTRNAWEAFTESQAVAFPKVHGLAFRPECPPGAVVEEEGRRLINSYVPIDTPATPGDVSPFLRHLELLLPDENDRAILCAYIAALVQYPGVKFQWSPLLQGTEGNGKTVILACVSAAVGHRYTHLPNASDLGGNGQKFNSWIERKLFIGVEEIYVSDRREVSDALKPLITNPRIEIQAKGVDQYTGDNRANFIMCSNHKDAVLKTRNDRRYAPFFTAHQSVDDLARDSMTGDYFPRLYGWLRGGGFAHVTHWLRTYAIPDALNPATLCDRAPQTTSTEEAVTLSLGGIEQEILEAVHQGQPGFCGGWVSSMAVDRLVGTRRIPHNKRRQIMDALGYVLHPALRDGRVNSVSPLDNGKPRLYITPGHLSANVTDPSAVLRLYLEAQGGGVGVNNFSERVDNV